MANDLSMESLKALLGAPGLSNFGARPEQPINIGRNYARTRARAKELGDIDIADGSVSEADINSAYDEQQGNALRKLLLPVQAKGQYELAGEQMKGQNALDVAGVTGRSRVEAAKQQGAAQGANTAALIAGRKDVNDTNVAGRETVANIGQAGTSARTAANLKAAALRQRYQAVATGKEKPPMGFFESFTPGASGAAQQKLLADIQSQLTAAEAEAGAPEGVVPAAAPAGDMAARLAALRAKMGR